MPNSNIVLKVCEVFFSIQGEGPFVGFPTFFVRLFGCNLNCTWCDTNYAKPPYKFKEVSIESIVKAWQKSCNSPYVTITGGEPLIQEGVYQLMKDFLSFGAVVSLETNGSISLERVPKGVTKVMDIKTPSSGMERFNLYENFNFLDKKDAVKFVLKDEKDFDFSMEVIKKYDLLSRVQVIFSPVYGELSPEKLARWILETRMPIRMQIQLHKYLNLK